MVVNNKEQMRTFEIIQSILNKYKESLDCQICLVDIVETPDGIKRESCVSGIEYEWIDDYGVESSACPDCGYVYVELESGHYGKFEYQCKGVKQ